MIEIVNNKRFVVNNLTDNFVKFKSSLRSSNIPYVNVEKIIKTELDYAFSLDDLKIQIMELKDKPVIFINETTFADLGVLDQDVVKKFKSKISDSAILQVELMFKVDGLFVKVKYQSSVLFDALTAWNKKE